MVLKRVMCVSVGALLLMQPARVKAEESGVPSVSSFSTVQQDGFSGKVKSVRYYAATADPGSNALEKRRLLYAFAYDSLGRRTSASDMKKHLIYKYGFDKRGNMVRSSVLCDTMKERMSDTLFVYDKANLLKEKRISSWGERMETEHFEYDSLGQILSRKVLSDVGGGNVIYEERNRYDKNGRLMTHVERDRHQTPVYKEILGYNEQNGKIASKRVEQNGLLLHLYRYDYDSLGLMTQMRDESKIDGQIALVRYRYDRKGRLSKESRYGADNTFLGYCSYAYFKGDKIKKKEEVKMTLSRLDDSNLVNEWDKRDTTYNKKGLVRKVRRYMGKGDQYIVYEDRDFLILPNGMILPFDSQEAVDYVESYGLYQCEVVRNREKLYLRHEMPIDYIKGRYNRHGDCVRYWRRNEGPQLQIYDVKIQYKDKNKPTQRVSLAEYKLKNVWEYDAQGNAVRLLYYGSDLKTLESGLICEFEYWK